MDDDDEMAMHLIMQEEDDIEAEEEESIAILACLAMQIEEDDAPILAMPTPNDEVQSLGGRRAS